MTGGDINFPGEQANIPFLALDDDPRFDAGCRPYLGVTLPDIHATPERSDVELADPRYLTSLQAAHLDDQQSGAETSGNTASTDAVMHYPAQDSAESSGWWTNGRRLAATIAAGVVLGLSGFFAGPTIARHIDNEIEQAQPELDWLAQQGAGFQQWGEQAIPAVQQWGEQTAAGLQRFGQASSDEQQRMVQDTAASWLQGGADALQQGSDWLDQQGTNVRGNGLPFMGNH